MGAFLFAPFLGWSLAYVAVNPDRHPGVVSALGIGAALIGVATGYIACWG